MNLIWDTNAISALLKGDAQANQYLVRQTGMGNNSLVCMPVHYEVLRGLLHRNAVNQLRRYNTIILPSFTFQSTLDADWLSAAQLWADTVRRGRQFSDVDLLVAAVAIRLDGIIVSNDQDFDALSVKRESW
jgi:predicted nucleic acid-binding protein